MIDKDLRAVWDNYTLAWKETTPQAKMQRLRGSTAPACVYRDPLASAQGQDALFEYMMGLHGQIPGAYFQTTWFQAHNDRSISKWTMHDGAGAVVGEGVSYGEYDDHGKLRSMTGFFDTPQA